VGGRCSGCACRGNMPTTVAWELLACWRAQRFAQVMCAAAEVMCAAAVGVHTAGDVMRTAAEAQLSAAPLPTQLGQIKLLFCCRKKPSGRVSWQGGAGIWRLQAVAAGYSHSWQHDVVTRQCSSRGVHDAQAAANTAAATVHPTRVPCCCCC
jgi:hypothetical protein